MTPYIGQLTDTFVLPAYAQSMLVMVAENGVAQASGKYGKFKLDAPPEGLLRLNWASDEGPTLACWQDPPDVNLGWDGRVKIGGFVERLHTREIGGLEIVIAELVGGAFADDYVGLPTLEDMRQGIFARPAEIEPLDDDHTYPLIILAESNMAALAQDALVSGLAIDAYATLAEQDAQWHEVVGLPLVLESLTLLAP